MSESNNSQTNIIRDLQRANEILAEVTASLESQKAILNDLKFDKYLKRTPSPKDEG